MVWACTATGEYSLRVQQHMGSGAFNVGIKDKVEHLRSLADPEVVTKLKEVDVSGVEPLESVLDIYGGTADKALLERDEPENRRAHLLKSISKNARGTLLTTPKPFRKNE